MTEGQKVGIALLIAFLVIGAIAMWGMSDDK